MCWRASAGVRWCPVELSGAPRRGARVVEKCQPGLGDAQYTRVRGPGWWCRVAVYMPLSKGGTESTSGRVWCVCRAALVGRAYHVRVAIVCQHDRPRPGSRSPSSRDRDMLSASVRGGASREPCAVSDREHAERW